MIVGFVGFFWFRDLLLPRFYGSGGGQRVLNVLSLAARCTSGLDLERAVLIERVPDVEDCTYLDCDSRTVALLICFPMHYTSAGRMGTGPMDPFRSGLPAGDFDRLYFSPSF